MARRPKILLIDNYDSFTWNLVHLIGSEGIDIDVHRNDRISVAASMAADPDAIVLSPGPCTPTEAGICLDLIRAAAPTIPILGVCLGHQAIGDAFGGTITRAPKPEHGKVFAVTHQGRSLFRGLNGPVNVTRYHSLVVDRASLPPALLATAETDDGLIMGLMHRDYPSHGVQFHPESIASEHGGAMIRNFLALAQEWNRRSGRREA